MKKLYFVLPITAALATVFLIKNTTTNENIRSYFHKSQKTVDKQYTANEALEFRKMLYKDAVTGKIELQKLAAAKDQVKQMMLAKSTVLSFVEEGPDNIGGRTRGLAVDPDDDNVMFAGSVSGGLFVTRNKGTNWERVQEFDDAMQNSASGTGSLGVSSIAITKNGVLYVATGGSAYEGNFSYEGSANISGDGIWYSMSTTNFNFQQLSGTDNRDVLKVVADPAEDNKIYFTGVSLGLNESSNFQQSQNVSGISATATIGDVKISDDGLHMVLGVRQGGIRTWVSHDGGSSFTDLHSNGSLQGFGFIRGEYSISMDKNSDSNYVMYALFANSVSQLGGVYRSIDNGDNWCQIAPQSTASFAPLTSRSGQGWYDLVILSSPDGETCTLGGIDLWDWVHTPGATTCDNGQWYRASNWAASPTSPNYIHADNHRLTYNSAGEMIVGNDGGVQIRTVFGNYPVNKGYNVTQFYSMAFGGLGAVIAGAQDNGTLYKDNSLPWKKEFNEVSGGDGFECEISYLDPSGLIATVYNGAIRRSDNNGTSMGTVSITCSAGPGEPGCAPFYNAIALMENPEDLQSRDSVQFWPPDTNSLSAGDTITYYSENFGMPIRHVLTQDVNVYDTSIMINGTPQSFVTRKDTIVLPDFVQSYFVTQWDNSVFITRDIWRFSKPTEWWKLHAGSTNFKSFEISHDMNYVWCGTTNGQLVRVSGLSNVYSAEGADLDLKPQATDSLILLSNGDTITGSLISQIDFENDANLYSWLDGRPVEYNISVKTVGSFANVITDISVDPTDADKVCVTTAGTSGNHVFFSTDATSSNPSFIAVDGNLPDMPVFGSVLERDPSTDVIIIGTEYGVFTTDNPVGTSTTWTPCNNEIGPIPVFDVQQQWRDWEEGFDSTRRFRRVENPGAIYACTHGRGVWRADNLLSDQHHEDNQISVSPVSLSVYPNPASNVVNVSFVGPVNEEISLDVYDLNGRKINSIIDTELSNGKFYNITLDVSTYPLGTYLVVMTSNSTNKVSKFIKY